MALPRSDTFLQTTGSAQALTTYDSAWSITEGSDWSVPSGAGYATAPGSATDQTAMFDGGETWPDDQYAVVELGAATGHYRGPATRVSSGFGYHIDYTVGDTTVYFSLRNSGSNSNPTSWTISALSAGDFLRLESEGTTHRAYYATAAAPTTWNLIGSHTDSNIASGKPGMFAYTVTNDADTIRYWEAGALGGGGGGPAITAVSDSTPTNGQSISITGTGFGASQGSGNVTIGGVTQTVTAWSDTSITITVVRGTNRYLTSQTLIVTDNSAATDSTTVTLQPDADWDVITLTSVAGTGALEASPALASGDDIHWDTQGGSVEVFADATFSYDPGVTPGVTSFDFEVWTTGDGWGSSATQSIGTSVTYTPSGSITFSGTNVVKRTRALASSGNLTFSGTNLFEHTKELQPSGGITFSGTGGMTFVPAGATTWTWTPSGSITFSGSSQIERVRGYNPSGNVTLLGTNVVERVHTLTPSGTVNFSGSNVLIKTKQYTPSGNITFISGAAMNFLPEGEASGTASAMTLTFVGD